MDSLINGDTQRSINIENLDEHDDRSSQKQHQCRKGSDVRLNSTNLLLPGKVWTLYSSAYNENK